MARHRKSYRGLVRFPGLGRLSLPSGPVKPLDVVVGGVLGLVGSIAIQKAANAASASVPLPNFLTSGSPVVGGLVTGAGAYLLERKSNKSRATGHAIGAALAGLAVWGWGAINNLMAGAPVLGPQVSGYGAPLFANPRMQGYGFSPRTLPAGMGGPIFNNPNTQMANYNFSRLARVQGMGDENEDGNFPAP